MLVRLVWDDETTYAEAADLADKIIAAGWSRPVGDVGGVPGRSEAEIKAEAWDEAVRECHALGWLHDFALSDALERNPYHAARVAGTAEAGGRDE